MHNRNKPEDFVSNIFEAAYTGKLSSVVYLISNGTNKDSRDTLENGWHYEGATPLFYAVYSLHFDIVEYLLSQNVDVNSQDVNLF